MYFVLHGFFLRFFPEQLNLYVLFLRIRFAYADQLFASTILYVKQNPLRIETAIVNGCVQRL